MRIDIDWKFAEDEGDGILDVCRVLYAYTDQCGKEIIYIGKADRSSIRERFNGHRCDGVFDFMQNDLKLNKYGVLVGEFYLPEGKRLTAELIADTESLLINTLRPVSNVQSINSRISRLGMEIICSGDWPYQQCHFVDK